MTIKFNKQNIRTIAQNYPVTASFILLCSIVAIINLIVYRNFNFSNESVIKLGGLDKELISDGQIWRLLTYSIGHMSIVHFLVNMPVIFLLSRSLERYFGRGKFLLFVLTMSIGSGISFYYFYQGTIAIAGASGVGFGFIGILTYITLRYPDKISSNDRQFVLFVLVSGIIITFTVPGIAISGHVGGFISGVAVAFIGGRILRD